MSSPLHNVRTWLSGRRGAAPVDPGEEFLKSMNSIVGLDQLLDNFSAKLKEIVDASSVYIVLYEPITNRYTGTKAKGARPELLRDLNFMRTDNLIKWLNVNRSALEVARTPEVIRFLSPQEQEMLRTTNTALIVPMIVLNRLTGAIFLSPPSGGGTYEPLTIDLLTRLSGQSALALEHSLMYQFQEDKLKKIFHADKLAMVGELAAGAAHEIRNPLTSIRSTVQYLKDDLTQEKRRLVEGIIEEVDRIDHVIKGLLSFSKTSELRMDSVVVDEVLNQTLLLLDSEVRHHGIEIQKTCAPTGLRITGDASQLKQLFLNLLLNSIQAMPHGGAITITVSDQTGHAAPGRRNDAVRIEITDTGPGIPAENLAKVFDPFFTTKEAGTGLGLSIVYGIVGTHGGEIEIKSAANGEQSGTTVLLWFPKQTRQS